jgi:hypothetical protein
MNDFGLLAQDDVGGIFTGGILLLMLLLGLIGLALWIWALVSAIQNPVLDSTTRIIWVLVIIFTGFIGAIIYLVVAPRSASSGTPPPA